MTLNFRKTIWWPQTLGLDDCVVTLPFAVKLTLDAFLDSELKMDDLKAAMVESVQEDCLYRCADPGSADRQGDALSRDVCGKQKMGKATKLNLILTAATYKNIEEINFDILAHNLDSLPEEFLHSALTTLGFTFKKDYLFYLTKYLDHENGRIRAEWCISMRTGNPEQPL